MDERRPKPRKLLVATVGLATINFVGCGSQGTTANLVLPPGCEAQGTCDASVADAADAGVRQDAQTTGADR